MRSKVKTISTSQLPYLPTDILRTEGINIFNNNQSISKPWLCWGFVILKFKNSVFDLQIDHEIFLSIMIILNEHRADNNGSLIVPIFAR